VALNPDGTVNAAFAQGIGGYPNATVWDVTADGDDVLIGGRFDMVGTVASDKVARLTATTVEITPVAAQTLTVGQAVSLQLQARATPRAGALTITAEGSPPGLTFDPATRTISGAPTMAGTYTTTVTATAGGVSEQVVITWTVQAAAAPGATPAPQAPGGTGAPPVTALPPTDAESLAPRAATALAVLGAGTLLMSLGQRARSTGRA